MLPLMKKLAIWIAVVAVFVKVGNPLLDSLICPEQPKAEPPVFVPNDTDLLGYTGFAFLAPEETSFELTLGVTFLLSQSIPRWMTTIIDRFGPEQDHNTEDGKFTNAYKNATVDILDARKRSELTFQDTGFTLLSMHNPSETVDYRSAKDIKKFQEEIRPQLMELYPGATRIQFTNNVVRGGTRLGDQPAAINGPHLDYSQNDTARKEFHAIYPVVKEAQEQHALLGMLDNDDEEMRVLLGIWKPIYMKNPVCDHPLALMDARTFNPAAERPYYLHLNFGFFAMDNLNSANIHDDTQQWYYYSFQKDTEVLVFTQYSRGTHFANPHSSFENPNCPKNFESRVSIEMRAAVFFPREK